MENKPHQDDITSAPREPFKFSVEGPTGRSKTPTPPASKRNSPTFRPVDQFPSLFPPAKGTKSKSMTEAEIHADIMHPSEIVALGERLKNEEPPMSLDEARQRRASIKEERKRSIDFIRSRTSSRAAANGRPTMEMLQEGSQVRFGSVSSAASVSSGEFGEIREKLEKLEESEKLEQSEESMKDDD